MFRISLYGDDVEMIDYLDARTGALLEHLRTTTVFPAMAYVTPEDQLQEAINNIRKELVDRVAYFKDQGLLLEAQRIEQRTNYDLESLSEFGFCPGMENYSAQLEFRKRGQMPYTLLDYFGKDFLTIIDESHMMIPQIRGMFNTDRSRKETLVSYGFRLPSAIDNRPLNFDEFRDKLDQVIYTSATPGDYELGLTKGKYIQQIIRPTGLVDPIIEVHPTANQIENLIVEISERAKKNERTLITTLTIRMSEDLTTYLQERKIKVAYLHSELKTFERSEIINDLRKGVYDAVVGVNLLREGLDIPEVSLVAILDADKQGFLRNTRSLIQTVGRAARNAHGKVFFYADTISDAMRETMDETSRRREVQLIYNKKHHIIPKTVFKKIQESALTQVAKREVDGLRKKRNKAEKKAAFQKVIDDLREKMLLAAKELDFETAANLRDTIIELENEKNE
jgi:excinuclease ABC subunit B